MIQKTFRRQEYERASHTKYLSSRKCVEGDFEHCVKLSLCILNCKKYWPKWQWVTLPEIFLFGWLKAHLNCCSSFQFLDPNIDWIALPTLSDHMYFSTLKSCTFLGLILLNCITLLLLFLTTDVHLLLCTSLLSIFIPYLSVFLVFVFASLFLSLFITFICNCQQGPVEEDWTEYPG